MSDKRETLRSKVEELEKAEIINALRDSDWIKSKAAKALGITERMVAYKIKKYGLEKEVNEKAAQTRAEKYRNQD